MSEIAEDDSSDFSCLDIKEHLNISPEIYRDNDGLFRSNKLNLRLFDVAVNQHLKNDGLGGNGKKGAHLVSGPSEKSES